MESFIILHDTYGEGKILGIVGNLFIVKFNDGNERLVEKDCIKVLTKSKY